VGFFLMPLRLRNLRAGQAELLVVQQLIPVNSRKI
jgi:hypothetical protein